MLSSSAGFCFFFFQAEDGMRELVRSRGRGEVYKRQVQPRQPADLHPQLRADSLLQRHLLRLVEMMMTHICLLYTSDAADERSSVDLGGRRIIKKKKNITVSSIKQIRTEEAVTTPVENRNAREKEKKT